MSGNGRPRPASAGESARSTSDSQPSTPRMRSRVGARSPSCRQHAVIPIVPHLRDSARPAPGHRANVSGVDRTACRRPRNGCSLAARWIHRRRRGGGTPDLRLAHRDSDVVERRPHPCAVLGDATLDHRRVRLRSRRRHRRPPSCPPCPNMPTGTRGPNLRSPPCPTSSPASNSRGDTTTSSARSSGRHTPQDGWDRDPTCSASTPNAAPTTAGDRISMCSSRRGREAVAACGSRKGSRSTTSGWPTRLRMGRRSRRAHRVEVFNLDAWLPSHFGLDPRSCADHVAMARASPAAHRSRWSRGGCPRRPPANSTSLRDRAGLVPGRRAGCGCSHVSGTRIAPRGGVRRPHRARSATSSARRCSLRG